MKKQIMSIAAAAALFTTGAMAFETIKTGDIVTEDGTNVLVHASYTAGVPAAAPLALSQTQKGDALIFPAYRQGNGWETEIVVRNTSANAIVAKAVLYAGTDSREVLDFNIYLSGKDVCRFKIKDGKVTSSDGSVKSNGIFAHFLSSTVTTGAWAANPTENRSDYRGIKFGDEEEFVGNPVQTLPEDGYVIVYGMEQTIGDTSSADITTTAGKLAFHNAHDDLYAAYAAALDIERAGWREITRDAGAVKNGMYVAGQSTVTAAPDVAAPSAATVWDEYGSTTAHSTVFTDVDPVLTGQVRITTAGRDLLLNATALDNYTDTMRSTWAPGEYASIGDRQIDAAGKYVKAAIDTDSTAFNTTSAVYTFANAGTVAQDNALLVTQPYKRLQAQLSTIAQMATLGYATTSANFEETTKKVDTGTIYAASINAAATYNEDEKTSPTAPQPGENLTGGVVISPRSGDVPPAPGVTDTFQREVVALHSSDIELASGNNDFFKNSNGFAEITVAAPAIVTQMTASHTGTTPEINWVYSDKN